MSAPAPGARWIWSVFAAGAYLLVALVTFRVVLASPSTTLAYPALLDNAKLPRSSFALLDHWDQAMVVSTVMRNAHLLVTRPWQVLGDEGQCYPMPRPFTLGEHMLGAGLVAAIPYYATGDPILAYNILLVLTIWIPGLTMYFFSLRFTRSPPAAFVAGLAFALLPARIVDPSHPYVHGDLWAPAALLFLHRLFATARWRDALGLALFLSLEVTESLYPLVSTSILAATFGLYLAARHRRELPRILPRLLLALAIFALTVWLVLGPYLATKETWALLEGRFSILLKPIEFTPGQFHFPGWIVGALAALALLDRLRGARTVDGDDPRLALLVGGLLVAWCAIGTIRVPSWDLVLPSPLLALRTIVPGLGAVRALAAVAIGVGFVTAFLAGYGMLAIVERLRARVVMLAVVAVVCLAIGAFRFYSPLARLSFGRTLRLSPYTARPPAEDIALLRRLPSAPQVDLPLHHPGVDDKRLDVAAHLLLASFAPRSLAACYNSFLSPANAQVIDLAGRLPEAGASDALAALGFETVLLHKNRMPASHREEFLGRLRSDPERLARLDQLDETDQIVAYRLESPTPVSDDLGMLVTKEIVREPIDVLAPRDVIPFPITNHGAKTFLHAPPIAPEELEVLWFSEDGRFLREDSRRALLPIALGAGQTMSIDLDIAVPEEPGLYDVVLTRPNAPLEWLSARRVRSVKLDTAMSPIEALVRREWDFVSTSVMPRGIENLRMPEDTLALVIAPGADAALENGAVGPLKLRWISSKRELAAETSLASGVTPDQSDRGIVHVTVQPPDLKGPHLAVLVPADRPERVLAARLVTVSRAEDAAAHAPPDARNAPRDTRLARAS